ncbi:sporulation protein [Nocardia sp. NEAU-351]|uniref:Sporulation protein n=1 Tax=Nocardia bovistercoris TaxID=2785916 RepID=A0A931IHL2_9NOCA|nr:sporulation protein [Nocardia bovistercoris]MBH0781734.1 sporulation protein [Nocardia bovistercoris]
MKVDEILAMAGKSMTVERVYGEPVEKDGIIVIPAAAVSGGGGGGDAGGAENGGRGVGFGMGGRPIGAYVIREGRLRWQPALDVNRAVAVLGWVTVVAVVVGATLAQRLRGR